MLYYSFIIRFILMSKEDKIEKILEEDEAAISKNKILKAKYILKQPNIFILLRWPYQRAGLQYGII